MRVNPTQYRKGLALTALGGLTLSFDIPLIRLAHGEPWTLLMLRTGTTLAVALVVWSIWRAMSRSAPVLVPGIPGAAVAALYGLGSICFVSAVFLTSTANLVFLLAFTTMFAALLSWIFLGERPALVTMAAMAAMLVGIFIIVGGSLGGGGLAGDALALLSSLIIASAITISRASGRDMGFASLVGVALPFVIAVVMVWRTGYAVEAPLWVILNGAVVMPISFFCLATGPRFLSGPEVAMFYLLETVLAPVWVWLVFSEEPSTHSLIGGTILVTALVAHSAWQWAASRRRASARIDQPA